MKHEVEKITEGKERKEKVGRGGKSSKERRRKREGMKREVEENL